MLNFQISCLPKKYLETVNAVGCLSHNKHQQSTRKTNTDIDVSRRNSNYCNTKKLDHIEKKRQITTYSDQSSKFTKRFSILKSLGRRERSKSCNTPPSLRRIKHQNNNMRTLKLPSPSDPPLISNEAQLTTAAVVIEIDEANNNNSTTVEEDLHPANVESLVLRCAQCFSKFTFNPILYGGGEVLFLPL